MTLLAATLSWSTAATAAVATATAAATAVATAGTAATAGADPPHALLAPVLAATTPWLLTILAQAARILTCIQTSPLQAIRPRAVAAGVALTLAVATLPATPWGVDTPPGAFAPPLLLVAAACIEGLLAGVALRLALASLQLLGALVDTQLGSSGLGLRDPTSDDAAGAFEALLGLWCGALLLHALTGLPGLAGPDAAAPAAELLAALHREPGAFGLLAGEASGAVTIDRVARGCGALLGSSMWLALVIGAPLFLCLLTAELVGGLIQRLASQLPAAFLVAPVRYLIALLLIIACARALPDHVEERVAAVPDQVSGRAPAPADERAP